jgi:hypothetical protein
VSKARAVPLAVARRPLAIYVSGGLGSVVFVSPINMNSAMPVRDELHKSMAHIIKSAEQLSLGITEPSSILALVAELRQANGILRVLEFDGAVELSAAALAMTQAIADHPADLPEAQADLLKKGLYGLQRYIEYCFKQREAYPLAVNAILNEMRSGIAQRVLSEAEQLAYSVPCRRTSDSSLSVDHTPLLADELPRIKRLQHMYRVGLLGVLTGGNHSVNLRLMACSVARLHKEFGKLADHDWWLLVGALLHCFARGDLRLTAVRRRLLTVVDGYLRCRLRDGEGQPISLREEDLGEVLCLLQLAAGEVPLLAQIEDRYEFEPAAFGDRQLALIECELAGNNDQLLSSQGQALREELSQVKDLLNSYWDRLDQQVIGQLTTHMQRVGDILGAAGFSRLKGLLADRVMQLTQAHVQQGGSEEEVLPLLAEALLVVESTLLDPQKFSDLALADEDPGTSLLARRAREEAIGVVLNESKAAIHLAKRGITAYLESNFDADHVANVGASLRMVQGAFRILEYQRAAHVLGSCIGYVESRESAQGGEDQSKQAVETLADALISIEYYLDELSVSESQNEELLTIAEESIAELGWAA